MVGMVTPLPVDGADVSHHQPPLNLARAKEEGLRFVYHKATEGDSYVDPKYRLRRQQARKAGIPFGAYHFARAEYLKGRPDAKAEARRFIEVAKPVPGDLRPALDLETAEGLTPGQLKTWAKAFSDEVFRLIGVRPVLYSPWELSLGLTRWVPRYNNDNEPPRIPWDIWQFSNGVLGVPDAHPGLGHVDLNTFRDKFGVRHLLITRPEPKPEPEPEFDKIDLGHFSMRFSDSRDEMEHDAEKIFSLGLELITGTEAGGPRLRDVLADAALKHDYRFKVGKGDAWVAVKKSIIKGNVKTGDEWVMSSKEGVGKHSHRTLPWISFDSIYGRRIVVGAGHYLTKGRKPGDPNFKLNVRYADVIGDWARERGKGHAIVFYGGDQNIVDIKSDTFLGRAPMTSLWDETEHYEGTGHGNIDVIATADFDGMVEGLWIKALEDKTFFLNSDHFGVRGRVRVKRLRR